MANLHDLDAADGHGNLDFHDFFPLMAQKLGDHGLMQELAKGFQMLADPSTQTITVHSLRRCASSLGLSHFSDQDLLEMFQLGDASGRGELDLHQFCVAMVRSSPDLMEEALRVILDDGYEADEAKGDVCAGSDSKESDGDLGDGHETKVNESCTSSNGMETDRRKFTLSEADYGKFTVSEADDGNFTVSEADDRKFTVSQAEERKITVSESEQRNFAGYKVVELENGVALSNGELEKDREKDFNLCANPSQKQRDAVFSGKAQTLESSSTWKLVDDAFPGKDQADTVFHGKDQAETFIISAKEEGNRFFSLKDHVNTSFPYNHQADTTFPDKAQASANPKKRRLSGEASQGDDYRDSLCKRHADDA